MHDFFWMFSECRNELQSKPRHEVRRSVRRPPFLNTHSPRRWTLPFFTPRTRNKNSESKIRLLCVQPSRVCKFLLISYSFIEFFVWCMIINYCLFTAFRWNRAWYWNMDGSWPCISHVHHWNGPVRSCHLHGPHRRRARLSLHPTRLLRCSHRKSMHALDGKQKHSPQFYFRAF